MDEVSFVFIFAFLVSEAVLCLVVVKAHGYFSPSPMCFWQHWHCI